MISSANNLTKLPLALIVDDQPKVGFRLKADFLDKSGIGVIFAQSLTMAVELLGNPSYDIQYVVTDFFFESGFDASLELFDGLDLIEFVSNEYPTIKSYLITANGNKEELKAKNLQFPDVPIFYKQDFMGPKADLTETSIASPSNVIRLDLHTRGFFSSPDLIAELHGITYEEAHAKFLDMDFPPVTAYIQKLESPLILNQPIPVIITKVDDDFCASAPNTGLLIDGWGETATKAMENLKFILTEQYLEFKDSKKLEGYAASVWDTLNNFITYKMEDTSQHG